jgi:hypothetical protein
VASCNDELLAEQRILDQQLLSGSQDIAEETTHDGNATGMERNGAANRSCRSADRETQGIEKHEPTCFGPSAESILRPQPNQAMLPDPFPRFRRRIADEQVGQHNVFGVQPPRVLHRQVTRLADSAFVKVPYHARAPPEPPSL